MNTVISVLTWDGRSAASAARLPRSEALGAGGAAEKSVPSLDEHGHQPAAGGIWDPGNPRNRKKMCLV